MGRSRTVWHRGGAADRAPAAGLPRRQAVALLAALALGIGAVAAAAALISPNRARSFDLIHGSLFLADNRAPVAVDLATGRPTVRLLGASSQVDARGNDQLALVPLAGSTLLLNSASGEFNLVDGTGFVVKTSAGGVSLPRQTGTGTSMAVAAGAGAYIVRASAAGTSVYLVNAATVQSAAGAGATAVPRASVVLRRPSTADPGLAVSAGDDLWLLTGTTSARSLRQLSLPADSGNGATLTDTDRADLTGLAALASAGSDTDAQSTGAQQSTVALGTPDRLVEFTGAAATRRVLPVRGLTGVDEILPVSNADSRPAFLFHAPAGWQLVSAGPDDGAATVHPVRGIPADVRLAAPAASNGRLYTVDRGRSGALWQIEADGRATPLTGAAAYPTRRDAAGSSQEVPDYGDARVVGERSRVLVNSPSHVLALAVFTDGSAAPTVIDKSSAADLNAAGGASAITTRHNSALKKSTPAQQQPKRPAPQPKPPTPPTPTAPAVNEKVSCKTTTQTPHVPTIASAVSASRSVLLRWNYPLLDTQDCAPSTYLVTARTLTAGSPGAPGEVQVQGQQSINLTGLYPGTRYQLSVTAFLNGRGTASSPVVVTTGPEGPAAPTGVTASATSGGAWTVDWHSCAGVRGGCVPAASWSVIPRFCDGLGLSDPPAPLPVAGDPTLSRFSTTFDGGRALLGRGLSFAVQGVSDQGNTGTTSAGTGCAYSWAPPRAEAMHLTASEPAQTDLGGSTTSTFTLDLGKDPVTATGGVGGQVSFQLLVGGRVVASRGPATATTATFDGIRAGTAYTGRATVSPPRHPAAAVTIGPVSVSTRSSWPAGLAVSTAKVTRDRLDPRRGTLTVQLTGLASADAGGERFDLTGDSSFSCGNTSEPLSTGSAIDPSSATITAGVDLLQYNGNCSVSLQLVEDTGSRTDPPVFGGVASPRLSRSADMPPAPSGGIGTSDFTAAWDRRPDRAGYSTITIRKNDGNPNMAFVVSWEETISDQESGRCGYDDAEPTVTLQIARTCVRNKGGDPNAWSAAITYKMLGQPSRTVYVRVTGTPPTFQPPTTPTPTPTPPTPTPTPTPPLPTPTPTPTPPLPTPTPPLPTPTPTPPPTGP